MDESKAERVPLTQKEKTIYLIVTIVVVIGLIALASTRWVCATEPDVVSESTMTVPDEPSRSDEIYVSESDEWWNELLSDSEFPADIYFRYADEGVSGSDSTYVTVIPRGEKIDELMAKMDEKAAEYAMSATDTATPEEAIDAIIGNLKGDR